MTTTHITHCPICGGELQASEEGAVYYSGTSFDLKEDGTLEGSELGEVVGECEFPEERIYCENDHTLEGMIAHLQGETEVTHD